MWSADTLKTFVELSLRDPLTLDEQAWMAGHQEIQQILDPLLASCYISGKSEFLKDVSLFVREYADKILSDSDPNPMLHLTKAKD